VSTGRRPRAVAGSTRSASRERHERIYTVIRDRICLLDYAPGSRLSEEQLAREWRVSRTPVRRVLARLESEGLVESRHGVGTMVTDVDFDTMTQVYRLRVELATLIGRLDPVVPRPDDIASMRDLLRRCDALAEAPDPKQFARLNMDFFQQFAAMIGNRPLREISELLYYRTARIWQAAVPNLDIDDEIAIFRREIAEIVTAMEAGDLNGVGIIRRRHISMSLERLVGYAPRAAGRRGVGET